MQRRTIIWGVGGAVVFPAIVLLLAFYKDSLLTYPSVALRLLDQVLDVLTFPIRVWNAVLPRHGDPTEVTKQFWFPIWISCVLYLAGLGFGIGVLLSKAAKTGSAS